MLKNNWSLSVLMFIAFCVELPAAVLQAEEKSPVAPGAKLRKLAGAFKFTEGPAADAAGNVYFTDQPNDRILRWSVAGELSTFLQPAGRSNGLYFDKKDRLWACADGKNELWRIDVKSGQSTVVAHEFNDKLFNGPNDLWIHPSGGVYFTDPFYKRPYWERGPMEQDEQAVYYLAPGGKQPVRAAMCFDKPNGIVGTPDGKTLYVADIRAKNTYAFDIEADATLKKRRRFCDQGSDGMTLDAAGNVYLTGKGVTVFNAAGEKIHHIDVPEKWTANVCFGGSNRKTLFITASTGFYAIEMQVAGAAP